MARESLAHLATLATVESNKRLYTKAEVANAERAWDLLARLGYPSIEDAMAMLSNGAILNCPITMQDLLRAQKIFGTGPIAAIKGKSTWRKPHQWAIEHVGNPVAANQVLHADILFLEGVPSLISGSVPLGMTMVSDPRGRRTGAMLLSAVKSQIAAYREEAFQVIAIRCDGEPGLAKVAVDIRQLGVRVDITGAGEHVPVVERKIRVVKERVRAQLAAPLTSCQPF